MFFLTLTRPGFEEFVWLISDEPAVTLWFSDRVSNDSERGEAESSHSDGLLVLQDAVPTAQESIVATAGES